MAVLLSSALVLTPSSLLPPKRSPISYSRLPGRVRSVRCEAVGEGSGRVPGPTVYQGVYGPWSVDQTDVREIHAAVLNVRLKTPKNVSCVRESRAAFRILVVSRISARLLKTGNLLTAKAQVFSEATSA